MTAIGYSPMTVYCFEDPALFSKAELFAYLDKRKQDAIREIARIRDDDLRGGSVDEAIQPLLARFRLRKIVFREGEITTSQETSNLPTSRIPDGRWLYGDHQPTVAATLFRFFVPFDGDADLLQLQPNMYDLNPPRGCVSGQELIFNYKMLNPDAAQLEAKFRDQFSGVKRWAGSQEGQIDEFNLLVTRAISERAESRRAQLVAASKVVAALSFPSRQTPKPPSASDTQGPQATKSGRTVPARPQDAPTFDVFISHASEDKDDVARPLYEALTSAGLSVWFDEARLRLGDSLRRKIDEGLACCSYGVVILSSHFFVKDWPQRELDGLTARETATGKKAILPIWHNLAKETVARYSPTLADKLAARTDEGIEVLAKKIIEAVRA
jgi:hypothetical protein